MTGHQVSSASEEFKLIGSYWQHNIPKWQHLISSFCPVVSLALSLPLSLVFPSHFSKHHYLIISLLPNSQTNTQWHEWINMLKCARSSWCVFALLCLSASQVASCCLKTPSHLPHLPLSLLLVMRLSNATVRPQQQPKWAAKATNPLNMQSKHAYLQTNNKKKKQGVQIKAKVKWLLHKKLRLAALYTSASRRYNLFPFQIQWHAIFPLY